MKATRKNGDGGIRDAYGIYDPVEDKVIGYYAFKPLAEEHCQKINVPTPDRFKVIATIIRSNESFLDSKAIWP